MSSDVPEIDAGSLFAYLITTGPTEDLAGLFLSSCHELGEASGERLHYIVIGNPRIHDRIYEEIQSPELRERNKADGPLYDKLVHDRGGDVHHRRCEEEELLKILDVERSDTPCLLLTPDPESRFQAILPIDPRILDSEQSRREFIGLLCKHLTEKAIARLAGDIGFLDDNTMRDVQDYLYSVEDRITALLEPEPAEDLGKYVFRREGPTWVLVYDGSRVHVPHRLGLAYIHQLLQNPNRDIPAIKLWETVQGETDRPRGGSGGEVADRKAITNLAKRLKEIKKDLTEAEADDDLATKRRFEEEEEAILAQLGSAKGLGGRLRPLSDEMDKIRQSVCRAVERSIEKLQSQSPGLANHLRASITKGAVLKYMPGRPIPWET